MPSWSSRNGEIIAVAYASNAGDATRRAFALRGRLSPSERMLLEAQLGESWPSPYPLTQRLPAQERAATLQPDSPDALFLAGDLGQRISQQPSAIRRICTAGSRANKPAA